MSVVLRTEGLCRNFGAVVAADNINVSISSGERVGIIGTNGAGKTTFVNMVTAYIKPSSGRIELAGEDVTDLSPIAIVRRGVGRSFQIAQLFSSISVRENLLIAIGIATQNAGRRIRKFATKDACELCDTVLEEFGIAQYGDAKVEVIPQGARKLLDIAMATVTKPKLTLLDEPTSGVSSEEKFDIMDRVFRSIASENSVTILIEHDMEIVRRYSDRVLAFVQGRIIQDGSPDAVLSDPEVRALIVGGSHA